MWDDRKKRHLFFIFNDFLTKQDMFILVHVITNFHKLSLLFVRVFHEHVCMYLVEKKITVQSHTLNESHTKRNPFFKYIMFLPESEFINDI